MPSVRHIVLAYSDQMRVEHYARTGEEWHLAVLTSPPQELTLDAVEFTINLARIYFDLPLGPGRALGS
jgi:hypothetical protein